jgi:hypothetical protein
MAISKKVCEIIIIVLMITVFATNYFINYPIKLLFIGAVIIIELIIVTLYYRTFLPAERKRFWSRGMGSAVIIAMYLASTIYLNYKANREIKEIDMEHGISR